MENSNPLISFLRHYGPITTSDNMYDELIQSEIDRHGINPAIQIKPAKLPDVLKNFESTDPKNVILTGTAGDGKTFHCRSVWTHFGGDSERWKAGEKIVTLALPNSSKNLTIVKDLSELTQEEKKILFASLNSALSSESAKEVFLIAANDGQLLASWRDWSDCEAPEAHTTFKIVEDMLVEGKNSDSRLNLSLFNLSSLDASEHFERLVEQILEHPQWQLCENCELMGQGGTSRCPIRINRQRLRGSEGESIFRRRLRHLLRLARANRLHIPIRDLLLLGINILLGDQHPQQTLLTCRTAHNRAQSGDYRLTNPYANVFGVNLPERQRQQYQVFNTLEAFGVGRETDNRFDNLLIYGAYSDSELYKELISEDKQYGALAYKPLLQDYLEGERENTKTFMRALSRQRQRLFFTLPENQNLDPWRLTVYQSSGRFLHFIDGLAQGLDVSRTAETLIRGLNRTFCGMMIDDGTKLYVASSGGDGRGRIASILNYDLSIKKHRRDPYIEFSLGSDEASACLVITDPTLGGIVDSLNLQLTHFEYLVRVANGSLPASFSRQCHEDFLDFKLRLIEKLDRIIGEESSDDEVTLTAITVDSNGRAQDEEIHIRLGQ
ncbi:MAG: hypothetical protein FH755_13365 [Methylophaga sp.]|nr:hypothetical protein [Methylophaga sp.]